MKKTVATLAILTLASAMPLAAESQDYAQTERAALLIPRAPLSVCQAMFPLVTT